VKAKLLRAERVDVYAKDKLIDKLPVQEKAFTIPLKDALSLKQLPAGMA
jgi:hypothetical protein